VQTDVVENNTVHCEYYRPNVSGKHPAVIVLHILGGDFPLARVFANSIAQRGVGALFLKMPYYGPRRGAHSPKRMITPDPRETVEGMTQAILDIRQAAAFLSSREEVDSSEIGVFGISLGGITGALALTAEPRLKNGCFLLAGGDMGQVAWHGKELEETRQLWLQSGGTKEAFFEIMKAIDPAVYASNAKNRNILMLNAIDDEVIPKACTESLWRAFGEPQIVWYDGGHYSVARHLLDAMKRTQDFFCQAANQ
jgi:dienelactone hydrolase